MRRRNWPKKLTLEMIMKDDDLLRSFRRMNGKYFKIKFADWVSEIEDMTAWINTNNFDEKLYVYLHGLTSYPKCPICESDVKTFYRFNHGYKTYCSFECKEKDRISKGLIARIEKYGYKQKSNNILQVKNKVKNKDLCIDWGIKPSKIDKKEKEIINLLFQTYKSDENDFDVEYIKILSTHKKAFNMIKRHEGKNFICMFPIWAKKLENYTSWIEGNNFDEKLYVYLHQMLKFPDCPVCGRSVKKFNRFKHGYNITCSRECNIKYITNKRQKTFLRKYGVEHPAQVTEVLEKQQKSAKTWKNFTMPSGKVVKVQGYENKALVKLLEKFSENDLVVSNKDISNNIGNIWYEMNNKKHRYYPDIYIKSLHKIIEVKSSWTYSGKAEILEENILKQQACINAGLDFEFMIF